MLQCFQGVSCRVLVSGERHICSMKDLFTNYVLLCEVVWWLIYIYIILHSAGIIFMVEIFQPNVASVQLIIRDYCLICKRSNVSICKRSLSILYAFQIIMFDSGFYAHAFFTRDKQVEKFLQFCLRNSVWVLCMFTS